MTTKLCHMSYYNMTYHVQKLLDMDAHMDNCNAKLLCKLAAPYMHLYCNNGQFFMFFIIKMFIFQKV